MTPTGTLRNLAPGKGGIDRAPATLANHRFFAGSQEEMLRRCLKVKVVLSREGYRVTGFAEGEVSKQTDKFVGGQSLMKLPHYFGPCTPPGPPHHYILTLMATDLEPTALKEGMTRDELIKALDGHAKGATSLVGIFSKQ